MSKHKRRKRKNNNKIKNRLIEKAIKKANSDEKKEIVKPIKKTIKKTIKEETKPIKKRKRRRRRKKKSKNTITEKFKVNFVATKKLHANETYYINGDYNKVLFVVNYKYTCNKINDDFYSIEIPSKNVIISKNLFERIFGKEDFNQEEI